MRDESILEGMKNIAHKMVGLGIFKLARCHFGMIVHVDVCS